ncbi:MAG: hypothetical protein ACH6QP_00520 [Candidatus Carsonella ruddii]
MLSFKKNVLFKKIKKIIICNFKYFHIDIIDYSYINNNSFCEKEFFLLFKIIKKFLNLKFEVHLMTKYKIKKKIKMYFHLENKYKKNKIVIGGNFCWKYYKKKILIMSVLPGFGNQFFLKKTKYVYLKMKNLDGGINLKIYKIIKNYLNKIIIGTSIIYFYNINSFFIYNLINNNFKN